MLAAIKARFPPLVKHTVQDSTFSQNHAPSLHRVFVQSVLCAPLNPAPPSIHAPRSRRRCGPRPPPESAGNTTPARAVIVKNRPSARKIVERRRRPPQQSVQNHRQLRARHRSVPAALTGTIAASSSMIRNMETQTFFMEQPSLNTPYTASSGLGCKPADF